MRHNHTLTKVAKYLNDMPNVQGRCNVVSITMSLIFTNELHNVISSNELPLFVSTFGIRLLHHLAFLQMGFSSNASFGRCCNDGLLASSADTGLFYQHKFSFP